MEEEKSLYFCIGDLAYNLSFANPKVCKVTGVFKDTQNAEYDYAYIELVCSPQNIHKTDYWELGGIPITDEILKENGFRCRNYDQTNDFYREDCHLSICREKCAGKEIYNAYLAVEFNDDYYVDEDQLYIGTFKYVHELQQALRLLGAGSNLKVE